MVTMKGRFTKIPLGEDEGGMRWEWFGDRSPLQHPLSLHPKAALPSLPDHEEPVYKTHIATVA